MLILVKVNNLLVFYDIIVKNYIFIVYIEFNLFNLGGGVNVCILF